ncbi:MAG: hypothetical protein HKO72_01660 [Flavobacteriaceae bacterium]|nr:hypothetical protein [Bacteroidia bacterium]NNL60022.1 hypothetical protein [Flavobacteriaceae bacterium]
MKTTIYSLAFLLGFWSFAQEIPSNYRTKKVAVTDSIAIDTVSINSSTFAVKRLNGSIMDSTLYSIDFAKAILKIDKDIEEDSLIVEYLRYPYFLTRKYYQLSKDIIVENTDDLNTLYKLSQPNTRSRFTPFDGLTTSGSISRGVTVGNNQNSVLNSELDLQISGKLNEKVSLRASIQDANIPLQESGYSQRLDEFDQVFIELFSDKWRIRAGDIDLQNNASYFANFTKKVQGLEVRANLGSLDAKTELFASGALVRGQFSRSQFTAQEGNQGPYKLQGPNGELFVLIISGSETVYVNGVAVQRGENKDYVIDYNAGEIRFNATYPITSEMRITVDYQFSDRNYSRFIAFAGGNHKSEKLSIGASVYSENDAKNQPLQQNLSPELVQILANAGDDRSLMVAPSEVQEVFSENRILYKKELINGVEAFVFSNDPNDELYSLRFTLVGNNQGNYILSTTNAISNIYEYVAPISGIPQGNYEPIVQLVAPNKLQIAVINGNYRPTESTNLTFEAAGSKYDENLFSDLDDIGNDGFAGTIQAEQFIVRSDSLWNLKAAINGNFIDNTFKPIEQLFNAEFNRDWNLDMPIGDQSLIIGGIDLSHIKKGIANYNFEHLNYSENFSGNRHVLNGNLILGKWHIYSRTSLLNASSGINESDFLRSFNRVTYSFDGSWAGTKLSIEDNQQTEKATQQLTSLSQKFKAIEVFYGIGDSTRVFAEIGYKHRVNDSIRQNSLTKVNASNTYYLKSRLIQNNNTNLSVYANYRTLEYTDDSVDDENSLNSRIQYNQHFLDRLINWNTVFETNSGTLPQQDFTYIEVEPGQGIYTWIDYNGNGIQELEEFELAQFQDQGSYIRVLLPNRVFLKTHQNRFSQIVTINPIQWSGSANKTKKFFSRFHNQSSYLIDRKIKREGNDFDINPFNTNDGNQLALNLNFRNVLFFNRGKQRYTTSYSFLVNKTNNLLSVGSIENNLKSHQFGFNHKFNTSWLLTLEASMNTNESISENFASKNFNVDSIEFNPKLSYLLNDNTRFDIFYQLTNKDNTINAQESLDQQKYGVSFSYANQQKVAINGEFNVFSNKFEGLANTPVAYQMLEGLQPGTNFTWSLLAQKKLTKFLDLNLNYFGRKTETSRTIHTGTVQLRAYF